LRYLYLLIIEFYPKCILFEVDAMMRTKIRKLEINLLKKSPEKVAQKSNLLGISSEAMSRLLS